MSLNPLQSFVNELTSSAIFSFELSAHLKISRATDSQILGGQSAKVINTRIALVLTHRSGERVVCLLILSIKELMDTISVGGFESFLSISGTSHQDRDKGSEWNGNGKLLHGIYLFYFFKADKGIII